MPGQRGPGGENLAIDAARLGPDDAPVIVLLTSGLHGIEGQFGSAVQTAWLEACAAGGGTAAMLPPGVAAVLVHALNPFGFAWGRRWNENGVDLNRNFVTDGAFRASDPAYAESRRIYERLASFLNPDSPPPPAELYLLKALRVILAQGRAACAALPPERRPSPLALGRLFALGLGELKKTLPVGQYEYPAGLFYGGGTEEPEWSTRAVREYLPDWVGSGARTVVHIDLHTGLGARGEYKLLLDKPVSGSAESQWMAERFGRGSVESAESGTTAYRARGTLLQDCRERLTARGITYRAAVAEFGTCSAVRVLGALRAENRAHRFCRPGQPAYEAAKRQVAEAFCPADPRWRTAVLEQGECLIASALRAAAAGGGD